MIGLENRGTKVGLVRINTVRGEPYHVGGWKLTPVARIVSLGKARGRIGHSDISGWGFGFARIAPKALLLEGDEGDHIVPVIDTTARTVVAMLGTAAAVALLVSGMRWMMGRRN